MSYERVNNGVLMLKKTGSANKFLYIKILYKKY